MAIALSEHEASMTSILRALPTAGFSTQRSLAQAALALFVSLSVACGCNEAPLIVLPDIGVRDAGQDTGRVDLDDGSVLVPTELTLSRVSPDHGPFSGGTVAILRGSGFTDTAQVRFAGQAVQPADHRLIDARRLQVVVPAGMVGTVDVSIEINGATTTLRNGYTYDALSIVPSSGSIAGGTFLEITGSGTEFMAGDRVILGRTPCNNVQIVSPTTITCRAPAGSVGTVDVIVERPADGSRTTAVQAYSYYDSTDPLGGGLGGGALEGSLNLTVINEQNDEPVEGAFALVVPADGTRDLSSSPYQGLTDARGQRTFSGPDLRGQQVIHISKDCFERISFVAFDARDVTVNLSPLQDPRCGMGSGGGGGGRGRNGAIISGQLIFKGPDEFQEGPQPWIAVPEPQAGWQRVAYVYTTQADVDAVNPDPSANGAQQRVTEVDASTLGYTYSIFARPAGLAVYALAGLENARTGQFIPYVMGVRRGVLAGPGQTVENINVVMDRTLDRNLTAELGARPPRPPTNVTGSAGPTRFRTQLALDMGGEGVISRVVGTTSYDVVRSTDGSAARFLALPSLTGPLGDARVRIISGWYSQDSLPLPAFVGQAVSPYVTPINADFFPMTVVVQKGLASTNGNTTLPDYIGIPVITSPATYAPLPADRIIRWSLQGPAPDFYYINLIGSDGNPAWTLFVRGDQQQAPIPDLSTIPGLPDIPSGQVFGQVLAIRIPGFRFDEVSPRNLNDALWTHYSGNFLAFSR